MTAALVRRTRALAGAVVTLTAVAALASELPARKPGLWEMSITSGAEPAVTTRQCIDAATDARMQQAGRGIMGANCSKDVTRRDGARWVTCDDEPVLREFTRAQQARLARDVDGNLVYLADNPVNLRLTLERWPKVRFHATREHGRRIAA